MHVFEERTDNKTYHVLRESEKGERAKPAQPAPIKEEVLPDLLFPSRSLPSRSSAPRPPIGSPFSLPFPLFPFFSLVDWWAVVCSGG